MGIVEVVGVVPQTGNTTPFKSITKRARNDFGLNHDFILADGSCPSVYVSLQSLTNPKLPKVNTKVVIILLLLVILQGFLIEVESVLFLLVFKRYQ